MFPLSIGRADFLATGDKKYFAKVKKAGSIAFRIINPSEFFESLAALLKKENE